MKNTETTEKNWKPLIVLAMGLAAVIFGGIYIYRTLTKTPIEKYFAEKTPFGVILTNTTVVNEEEKLLFFSVATFYPRTNRIGLISFYPDTRINNTDNTIEKRFLTEDKEKLKNEISKLLNIPIPYMIGTNTNDLAGIIDLMEGIDLFFWDIANVTKANLPTGLFTLDGAMLERFLVIDSNNESRPALELFRHYTLILNAWNKREYKWNLINTAVIFPMILSRLETNIDHGEMLFLGKILSSNDSWNISFLEMPVTVEKNYYLIDTDSSALYLKNFKKNMHMDENPYLQEPPRMEVRNGTNTSGLAKKFQSVLSRKGVVVLEFSNADHHHYQESIILDVSGNTFYTQSISKTLGIENVFALVDKSSFTDITLILGNDYENYEIQ